MYQMGVTVVMETIDASHKAEIFSQLTADDYEFYEKKHRNLIGNLCFRLINTQN